MVGVIGIPQSGQTDEQAVNSAVHQANHRPRFGDYSNTTMIEYLAGTLPSEAMDKLKEGKIERHIALYLTETDIDCYIPDKFRKLNPEHQRQYNTAKAGLERIYHENRFAVGTSTTLAGLFFAGLVSIVVWACCQPSNTYRLQKERAIISMLADEDRDGKTTRQELNKFWEEKKGHSFDSYMATRNNGYHSESYDLREHTKLLHREPEAKSLKKELRGLSREQIYDRTPSGPYKF